MANKLEWGSFVLATLTFCSQAIADQEIKAFGNWELRCSDAERCYVSQINGDPDNDSVRMRTLVSLASNDTVLAVVTLPQTVLLTEGPWLTLDGVYVGKLEYYSCSAGCMARSVFPTAQFKAFTQASKGVVTAATSDGTRVGIVISLDGLSEAFENLLASSER